MKWYTVTNLGDRTALTPEGYLLARDVAVARTGAQIYHMSEIASLAPNADGLIHVHRDATEVFRPDTIASFNGKPIVNDHPTQEVNPANWNQLAIGVMMNPRQGTGTDTDVLLADLLFTSPAGITAVQNGKRAVSVGYEAKYEQTAPGMGRQRDIICNHLALVDTGRCGARCTILDAARSYAADDFVESEHPREKKGPHGGEFTSGGTSASGTAGGASGTSEAEAESNAAAKEAAARGTARADHLEAKRVNGKLVAANGDPLPEHIAKLKIPPAWTNVTYNPDPNAALIATGKDAKGRRQPVYSAKHHADQAAAKFARIKAMDQRFTQIKDKNEGLRKAKDPRTKDAADAAALIMATGIRPGSEQDTGAEKQAYGATTLQGKHVVPAKGGGVNLRFTGKKGVDLDIPVTDPDIAKMLLARKEQAGRSGKLFPNTNAKHLSDHVHDLSPSGGGFKTKDFRTLLGTKTAIQEVSKAPAPKNEKEYKKAVMTVAKTVSTKLGNTPTIALQSYISPSVFAQWQAQLGEAPGMGGTARTADALTQSQQQEIIKKGEGAAIRDYPITANPYPEGTPQNALWAQGWKNVNDVAPDDTLLPEPHWGEIDHPLPDWTEHDDPDPDDEELPETPEDVIAELGFDPIEEQDPEEEAEANAEATEQRAAAREKKARITEAKDHACHCQENTMSKRTLAQLFRDAFFTKDKDELARIIKDAEEETGGGDHNEPDGDEGKHASNVHVHIEHKSGENGNGNGNNEPTEDGKLSSRVTKLEDGMKALDGKIDKVLDAVIKIKAKDDENPFAKKDGDDEDKDGTEKSGDAGELGGEEGAQKATPPTDVEAELMNADPALKTGPSKMGDAAWRGRMGQAFQHLVRETRARAEVLAPGMKLPTLDAATGPKAISDSLCALRRSALEKALSDSKTGPVIGNYITTDSLKSMSCDAVRLAFLDASDRVRGMNNMQGAPSPAVYQNENPRTVRDAQITRIREINKRNKEFWAERGGLGSIH